MFALICPAHLLYEGGPVVAVVPAVVLVVAPLPAVHEEEGDGAQRDEYERQVVAGLGDSQPSHSGLPPHVF